MWEGRREGRGRGGEVDEHCLEMRQSGRGKEGEEHVKIPVNINEAQESA